MGMYTRLVLNVAISDTAPIIETLKLMCSGDNEAAIADPAITGRLRWMFRSSSYYHDTIQSCKFEHDEISKCWKLSVTCDLKNYENEICRFCDWLAPYVETTGLAGYSRYEESILPELLWFVGGKACWITPELPTIEFDLSGSY